VEIKHINPRGHLYLELLKELAHMPALLYLKGSLPANRQISVAIVGSRKPTPYGKEVTFKLAYDLAKRGIVIISGLAYGVDSIAHRGALEAGGTTIAVLPSGLDHTYPAGHRRLAEEIVEKGGALISEYESGNPRKYQFLARNRLISGLADAVIITEAGERSGTLSTTNHALDQNKEVFAVPGNITSLLSIGPNRLIQQGAHPLLSADDVIEVVAPHLLQPQAALPLGSNPAETMIIDLLQKGIRETGTLQQQSGLNASEYASTLSMLELQGTIRSVSVNQWTLSS
jgi:DNA processing protein